MATLPHELLAIRIRNARLLACDADEEMSVIEEKDSRPSRTSYSQDQKYRNTGSSRVSTMAKATICAKQIALSSSLPSTSELDDGREMVVLSSNLNVAVHPLWFWFGITWYIKGSQQGVPALGVAEEYLDDDCLVLQVPLDDLLQVYTTPDSPDDPPHLTARLTISTDETGTTAYLRNDNTKGIQSTDATPRHLTPTMDSGATPHHFTQTPDTVANPVSETWIDNSPSTHTIREECEEAQLYFQELASKGRSIRILVTGQIHQGKSKLVNSLIGKKMAKEGDEVAGPHPTTHNIESFTENINGVQVTLVEMPGFSNLKVSDQNTNSEIGHKISEEPIDLILFCVRMDRKLERKDYEMMQNLTQMFGQSMWEHTVFVLTFANKLNPTKLAQKQTEWDKMLHEYTQIEGGVPADKVEQIPILVAGNEEENHPGYESWFSRFWVTAFKRTKSSSKEDLCRNLAYSHDSDSDCENECKSQRTEYREEEMINRRKKKEVRSAQVAVQEQGFSFPSEMVSVACMVDFTHAYRNSLVTGHIQHNNEVLGFYQAKGTPFAETSSNSTSDEITDIISSPATETLLCVSADPSLYYQLKSSTATHKQVSQSSSVSLRLPDAHSEREMTAKQACMVKAVNCFCYSQMLKVLKFEMVNFSLPAEVVMATQFATALACNKLDKYSKAAKHLLSLEIIAASAQTCGNEPIPRDFTSRKLAAQYNKPTTLYVNLSPPSLHTGEQLVSSTEQKALLDSSTLETFTCSLHVNLLVQKNVEQTKTLSNAFVVVDIVGLLSTGITYLYRLLGEDFIQQYLLCQDFSGHTPLHHGIETKNATTGVVMRFATHKLVLNPENLPSIVLLFEHKLWSITSTLEHQIASFAAKLLQEVIFQTMMKIRRNSFVPYLCLQGHCSPDLDLNFSESRSNSLSLCNGSSTPLSTVDTSSGSFSEGDMTSLKVDESDGSGGTLSIAKHPTRQPHSTVLKLMAPVPVVKHVSAKRKKSSVSVLYQCSGYSGDESDHTNECSSRKKFTLVQRAAGIKRRELHHEDSNSESEAETEDFSGQICMNTEDIIHVCDMDKELMFSFCRDIKLILQGTSCAIQISNFSDCSFNSSTSDSRVSAELHHAVKHQCFQLVRNILACDGGEDQICTMDEDGHTPLEIASQSKDLKIFELLLEGLICSQASSSVILQQCSSHQLLTLLASMIEVLSILEGDIDSSTLHWAMVCCQHWEIPRVMCATSTTVPTMLLPLWSNSKQLSMCRGGSRKKVTNELSVKQEQGVPSWSEMVSVGHRPNGNSLVVDLSLTENKWELR